MKYRLLYPLVLLTTLLPLSTNAQEVTTERIDELIQANYSNPLLDWESNYSELQLIDSLSRKINYSTGLVYANMGLAHIHRDFDPDITLKYVGIADSLKLIYPDQFDDTVSIELLLVKGYAMGSSGNLLEELNIYLEADSICKANDNALLQALTDQYLMQYYYVKQNYEKALTYNLNLQAYYAAINDDLEGQVNNAYVLSLLNTGNVYLRLSKPDSAIYFINRSIEEGYGNYFDLSYPYLLLAKGHLAKSDLVRAEDYVTKMKNEQGTIYDYTLDGAQGSIISGQVNLALDRFDEARADFLKALHFSDSIGYEEGKYDANYFLVNTYLKENQQAELIQNLEEYSRGKDSLYAHKSHKLEQQLLVQYETSQKEIEIERLRYRNRVNQATILGISLLLVILVLMIVMARYRYKARRRLLEQEIETEKFKKIAATKDLNQAIEKIKDNVRIIEDLKQHNASNSSIDDIIAVLNQTYVSENEWAKIVMHFDLLHADFTKKMLARHSNLTTNDIRLLILIKLGYSNKGIAEVNNISENGVKKSKQRLLKKIEMENFRQLKEVAELN